MTIKVTKIFLNFRLYNHIIIQIKIVYMKSGMLKHPYLGDTRTFVLNQRNMIQNKVSPELNPEWFKNYQQFKEFEWKYCLYPQSVYEDESYQFNNSKPKQNLAKKIAYSGYFVSNLKDQIITRSKNHAKFGQNEVLYILYTILMGWKEWKEFCKRYNFKSNFYAISSEYVLLNQEGDIKLITPISSPLGMPPVAYFAPQNVPPNLETPDSWNKSISFSLGLIGAELIAMKIAQPFYQYKGIQLKFNQEQYQKWIKFSQQTILKEVYNLVLLLTDQNPWVRLKIGQFEALLAPYKKDILACRQQKLNMGLSRNSLLQYLKTKKADTFT